MKRTDFRPTRQNVIQFLEYLVGGSVYFWSGYINFAVYYSVFGWDWLPAKMIADVVGCTLNYLIQRYWAFNNADLSHHEGQVAGRFVLVTIASLIVDYLIIWSLKAAGVSPYASFFISAGFFTVWNYFWYRFWVFFNKRNKTGVVNG
jgi:putative flippase GtrA